MTKNNNQEVNEEPLLVFDLLRFRLLTERNLTNRLKCINWVIFDYLISDVHVNTSDSYNHQITASYWIFMDI